MENIRILWSGITGKTANEVLKVAQNNKYIQIVAGICRNNGNYYNYNELDNIKEEFDVIIDFSHKDSFDKVLDYALEVKKPIIIGTAGLSDEQMKKMQDAAKIIPIFRGGNFRFEVKEFIDKIVEYAKTSDDEITLVERHYITVPIPSQTAKVIANRVLKETGKKVKIQSSQQSKENTNEWCVNNIQYKCTAYDEKLAKDIVNIAIIMKNKKVDGIYDLDRLFKEKID